jgi:hypothetical protein
MKKQNGTKKRESLRGKEDRMAAWRKIEATSDRRVRFVNPFAADFHESNWLA